jgi:hypothetical protein
MRRLLWLALFMLVTSSGCGDGLSPEVRAIRDRVITTKAPAGEQPIPEVRKELQDGTLDADKPFVVRARINAGDFPPFAEGVAAFVVTDATGHDGDEEHNPHECPFCKRDINSVIARVEFRQQDGKLIEIDARELLKLKEFDLLVIEGTGAIGEDDMLVIEATKIFVKR